MRKLYRLLLYILLLLFFIFASSGSISPVAVLTCSRPLPSFPYSLLLFIILVSVSFLAQLVALGNALTRWQWRYRSQDLNVSLCGPDKDHRLMPRGTVMKGHSFVCAGMSVFTTFVKDKDRFCGNVCLAWSNQIQS